MTDGRQELSNYYTSTYGDRSADKLSASARDRATLFREWAGRGKRILDIGCGSGSITRFLVEGNAVVGIDVDEHALSACAARGIRTVWADFGKKLPFDAESFEVVLATETIEHLPYPKILLAEIERVLVPGGFFLGSVPNEYSLKNRVRVLQGHSISRDPTHLHHFSLSSLRALLMEQFSVEALVPVRGKWRRLSPSLWAHSFAWRARRHGR
jgi:2-polyprenyl-3-methyl-5-hydroxy-6-metoxy-1,4-benzoquinol methylase